MQMRCNAQHFTMDRVEEKEDSLLPSTTFYVAGFE
jgi:hypothetical protein